VKEDSREVRNLLALAFGNHDESFNAENYLKSTIVDSDLTSDRHESSRR